MKLRLSRLGAVLGGTVAVAACAAVAGAGCGGDDSTSATSDGSTEATADGAGSDVTSEAEPQEASSGAEDAPSGDVQQQGSDAGDSGPLGTGSDASDASDANSVNEAASGPVYDGSLATYPAQVSGAFCTATQTCCLVSAAQWNQAACVRELELGGGFRSLSTYAHSLDGGHVELDASAAETCLSDMQSLLIASCGTVTSQNILRLQAECFGALTGTLGVDAGTCSSSIECGERTYCNSHGVCAPLEGLGGPCSATDNCAYRGSSDAGVYCHLAVDGGPGQCAPTEGLDGGDCATAYNPNEVCNSGLCGFEPGCAESETFTDPGPHSFYCLYIIPDAGPDSGRDGGDGG